MDDPFYLLHETAAYCRADDDKVPTLVGTPAFETLTICPAPGVTDAIFGAWWARVMFDELLDPDIEDLIPVDPTDPDTVYTGSLARSQPVTLTCGGAPVPYDGFYSPNGNNVTWPLGPSLVINPLVLVGTSASCSIMLKDTIVDKDGVAVPNDQLGPFTFAVEPLVVLFTDPDPGTEIAADAAVVVVFNAPLDPASLGAGEVLVADTGGPVAGASIFIDADAIVVLGPNADTWNPGSYTVTIPAASNFVDGADVAPGDITFAADLVIDFTVL